MVDEADKDSELQEPAETGPPSRLAVALRNWPLPVLILGIIVCGVGIWYWRGPVTHRESLQFEEDLIYARSLIREQPKAALPVLRSLLGRLWRAPEHRGEIYHLIGLVNDQLARGADIDQDTAKHYQKMSRAALEAAEIAGVPSHLKLSQQDAWAQVLSRSTDASDLRLALGLLSNSLKHREQIAWILHYHRLRAELTQSDLIKARIQEFIDEWMQEPAIEGGNATLVAEAHHAARAPSLDELRQLVLDFPIEPFEDNLTAAQIDQEARVLLEADRDHLRRLLADYRLENDTARDGILESLATAAFASRPPQLDEAIQWAKRRTELRGLPSELKIEAQLVLASLFLEANDPRSARIILKTLGTQPEAHQATLLLGKSLLDEAMLWRKQTLEEWLALRPELKKYAEWIEKREPVESPTPAPDAPSSANRLQQLGRASYWKATLERAQLQKVNQTLAPLLDADDLSDETLGEVRLWMSAAKAALGQYAQAREGFQQIIDELSASPLDLAARFHLADAFFKEGKIPEGIETLRSAAIQSNGRLANAYLRPNQVVAMIEENWFDLQNTRRDFASALVLADIYKTLKLPGTGAGQPFQLEAAASHELASQRVSEADATMDDALEKNLRQQARSLYRQAANAFLEVAKHREGTDEYPALLWDAAVDYFDGHDFDRAIPIFRDFIVAHVGGPRDFPARIYLARALMAQDRFDAARKVLEESLQESKTAVDRFKGRILLAKCYVELTRQSTDGAEGAKLLQQAEQLLLANLSGRNQELDPSAAEWRESLLALGRLMVKTGRYPEAVDRLQEYVQRFPSDVESTTVHDEIGEAHLAAALLLDQGIEKETSEREKSKLREQRLNKLQRALEAYRQVVSLLTELGDRRPLETNEQTLLSHAMFRVGRIHVLLGQWEEGLGAFGELAYRFNDRPECLSAYVEMSSAYSQMGRQAEADSSLRQALWILGRMDESAFVNSGRDRDEIRRQIESLLGGS